MGCLFFFAEQHQKGTRGPVFLVSPLTTQTQGVNHGNKEEGCEEERRKEGCQEKDCQEKEVAERSRMARWSPVLWRRPPQVPDGSRAENYLPGSRDVDGEPLPCFLSTEPAALPLSISSQARRCRFFNARTDYPPQGR